MATQLEIKLGQTASGAINGHSSLNGATIPENSTIVYASSQPTVGTITGPATVPAGGASSIPVQIGVLAVGSTDFTATITLPDGTTTFADLTTLLVDQTQIPGLVRISLDLTTP